MGRRSWLDKDLRDRWLPALAELKDSAQGHRKAKELCEEIRSGWAERGAKTLRQQQSLMDQTRVAIKEKFGTEHFSLDWIKFSTAEYTQLNNQKQDSVSDRNEAIQFIDDPDAIVSKAVELLDSPEWAEVCAGLAVLTGRRSSELLSTARFEKASKWSVMFTGALKRRGELQELSFEIPTLTTADRVVRALEKVRSQLPDATELSAESVNRKYGQAVIRACDKHFEGLVPSREGKDNLYTHLFRAVYATISTFWYCPSQVNETEFKAAIQGHYAILNEKDAGLRRSLAASRHYSDYEIADDVIANYGGKRKGIKLGHGGVKPIEVFAKSTSNELTEPQEKLTRDSVRIWKEDRALLDEIFDLLGLDHEGTQPNRMRSVLRWTLNQLQQQRTETELIDVEPEFEEVESVTIEPAAIEPEPEPQDEPEPLPTPAPALETKIDTLVNAIAQLVELQTKTLTAPTPMATPIPQTKRKVPAPTPAGDNSEEQPEPERKYRPRGENQELVDKAIDKIIEHNDQMQRHDEKWAITINVLKAFVGSQHAITKGLEARTQEIQAHHTKHQIDAAKHNLRHRGKTKIEDVIALG